MNICYLLESTDLCGGVKIVFDQARALLKRGHTVIIRSLRGDHRWYPYAIDIDYVSDLSSDFNIGSRPDVVIATFWTTVRAALELKVDLTFHLCQGYEGDFKEYFHLRPEIEAVYKVSIPKITIGKWLSKRLEEIFGIDSFKTYDVGQIVDLDIFRPLPAWMRQIKKIRFKNTSILVVGLYESSVKAIPDALKAVSLLREKRLRVRLIRVSTGKLSSKEAAVTFIDEYYTNISPAGLVKVYQKSDLFLAPSLSQEGFGLSFAEALACGIPSVATAIPSYLSLDQTHDYACFVPERDPVAIADGALKIIKDKRLQKYLRKRGIEVVNRNFRSNNVAERLESVFSEALK
jgi:glycosyltransferase involved in cell wall biosynthesis